MQREHICIFTEDHCLSLGFQRLDVNLEKKKYFSSDIIFFIPEKEISNSAEVFLVLILLHYFNFFSVTKKLILPQVTLKNVIAKTGSTEQN